MYDNNSDIFGFIYNDTEYYYIKNAQNDVIGIADKDGNILVKYFYDAWGKVIAITDEVGYPITDATDESETVGNDEQTTVNETATELESNSLSEIDSAIAQIAHLNPILYRSYYYDKETEWYYLNTRYYSPDMCRFINADGIIGANQDILSYNLFSYCSNNPINYNDDNGNCKISIKVSIRMLFRAFFGGGKEKKYNKKSVVSKTLSKSKIMKSKIDQHINEFKKSGKKSGVYSGTVSLYGKDNKSDFDLSYSVGKASYTVEITQEIKTSGFWFFKETKTRYVATVTVSDVYNFDEYRDDGSLGSKLNNWGYDMQKNNYIKPYNWEANYIVYSDWE